MAKLLIVDDHAAVRAGLAALVAPEPDLAVVASVADSEAALACVDQHAPELAVIDFHLPDEDGLNLCLRLDNAARPPGRVLYSAFADDLLGVLAAVAGAGALVPKSADPEQLLEALRTVANGDRMLPKPAAAALAAVSSALEPADLPVLGMLVHGTPPAEVADTLSMTPGWLLARRWAILRRLSPRRTRRGAPTTASGPMDSLPRSSRP